MRVRRILASLRDRSGVAAVEFALIAPIFIAMVFGLFEGTRATLAYLKVIAAAQSVADLVTQQKQVTNSDLNDYVSAGQLIMKPLPAAALGFVITSVKFDPNTGAATVDWQKAVGATPPANSVETALAANYGVKGESVVIVQATYTYTSPIDFVLPASLTITDTAFSRPRIVPAVPLQ
ncbi:MAG: TadE/TadG family type IV pilus assembly protein [Roseiarcus sp.]